MAKLRATASAVGLMAAALAWAPAARGQGDALPRARTPGERLAPAILKATHDDAARIQAARREVPGPSGLLDYRAIFHAHAEDSAHTGGTRPEMLADAHAADVHAVWLTDHHRPPRDFFTQSWHGLKDGVLFVPGSEARGFLLYPTHSVLAHMDDPPDRLLEAVRADGGLAFLSHVEERPHAPTEGLDGMEIYNRHADAKKDAAGVAAIVASLTDPPALRQLEQSLRLYPDEVLAAQVTYPADYLAVWDAATQARRLTGVAANDCHHNQVLLVKMVDADTVKVGTVVDADDRMKTITAQARPGIRAMTQGHQPGDVLARLDFDPYARSFHNVSTHLLARELTEPALRSALRHGHAYVSHDWMCDPTGFRFELVPPAGAGSSLLMGHEADLRPGARLVARFPVACRIRLLKDGRVLSDQAGDRLDHLVAGAGVYRVEAWLRLAGEDRPWIYSNPIYVRPAAASQAPPPVGPGHRFGKSAMLEESSILPRLPDETRLKPRSRPGTWPGATLLVAARARVCLPASGNPLPLPCDAKELTP